MKIDIFEYTIKRVLSLLTSDDLSWWYIMVFYLKKWLQ